MLKSAAALAAVLLMTSVSSRTGTGAVTDPERGGPAAVPAPAQARLAPATVTSAAPVINSIAPDTLEPAGQATITGRNFSQSPAGNRVSVDGIDVQVVSATRTRLVVRLPLDGFRCQPDRDVTVEVWVGTEPGSRRHPFHEAEFLALHPGEVATPDRFGFVRCLELAGTGREYLIGVVNARTDTLAGTFVLSGSRGRAAAVASAAPAADTRGGIVVAAAGVAPAERPAGGAGAPLRPDRADPARRATQRHLEALEAARERINRRVARGVSPGTRASRLAPGPLPAVNSIVNLRISTPGGGSTTYDSVRARTVHVGQRVIIFEDSASPHAHLLKSAYLALAAELDSVMWPIITRYFGNPVAFDASLDGDGRVRILFSEKVSGLNNASGFASDYDFYDPAAYPVSNLGEYLYVRMPKSGEVHREWLREARSTVIHELKHVAGYAERISRGAGADDVWIDEGGAEVAEELFARTFSGVEQSRNAAFSRGVACAVDILDAGCAVWPTGIKDNFAALYNYLRGPETWSPVSGDAETYGASWSFLRWAADASGRPEAEFFKELTQHVDSSGATNLAHVTRRGFSALLVDWHMALALDDWPGFTPTNPRHAFASWNLSDVYRGLWRTKRGDFPVERPLVARETGFGDFRFRPTDVAGASASFFLVRGTPRSTQMLALRTPGAASGQGDARPIRMAIARVR